MKKQKIKSSLMFITIVGVIITVMTVFATTYIPSRKLTDAVLEEHASSMLTTLKNEIAYLSSQSQSSAESMAEYESLIKAYEENDVDAMYNAVDTFYKVAKMITDCITLTDDKGVVLMR